jgi:molybdopterin converting factor small subunit
LKITVKFLGPLAREDKVIDVNDSLELKLFLQKEIGEEWLDSVAVAVNDTIVSNLDDIKNGDIISILPPVCGG